MLRIKGYKQVPLDPKLVGWFESDKVNNVNTALPANAAAITNWFDICGKGSIPTQTAVTNKPTFSTNVANGKPAVTFTSNGGSITAQSLRTSDAAALSNLDLSQAVDGFTIFVCAQIAALTPPSGQAGCILFMQGSSPSTNEIYQISQATSGAISNSVTTSASFSRTSTSGNAVVNTPFINSFWWDKANSAIRSQFNSNASVGGSGSVPGLNASPTSFAIGQQKNGILTRNFDGKIFAILIYARLLSSDESQYVKQYLGSKYGVTV